MSRFARPLLVAAILVVTAFYLGSPQSAVITLLAGSLVGFLIGSIKGDGAFFTVYVIGVASLMMTLLGPFSIFDSHISNPFFISNGIGWCAGFIIVGAVSLLSRSPKSTP